MTLRIHNTLSRATEVFVPIEPGHVRLYVCGITIYDYAHMGHARFMMAFDVAQRWLKTLGYRVTYVRNITDIDDKIIKRALERDVSLRALTESMIDALHQDADALGLERPTHEPRATHYVPQMLEMIAALERKGLGYRASNGDVDFAVRKFPGYGKLSGKSIDQLRSGERVAVLEGKQDPLDFVMWKAAKADEPDDAKWSSQFGSGRPGWHIECSAMCKALLGEHIDIHGGGQDLQFPHHENEIAQSEGASDGKFVNIWMHNGLLNVDNEKMSKSLGNFFTIRDVLKRYDGETVRFFMLRTHYRSPFNFSDASLDDAKAGLRRLYTALDGAASPGLSSEFDWTEPRASAFREAMNDDFNTPIAVSILFELAADINRAPDSASAVVLRGLGATLGILQQVPRAYLQAGASLQVGSIEALIEERRAAKATRDFALADAIRKRLADQGIVLKDLAQETTWVRA
ncbi:MAG: cysteine--tRNA ligase [Pseudomonadota bacterium]|nr:cysteine--tRNA ligase [Pseudomonadota bacterium]